MMRVHTHTRFCFLCVLTLLFHQCTHCHEGGHQHHGHEHHDHDNDHDSDHGHDNDHAHVHNDLQISKASYIGQTDHLAPGSQSEAAANEQQYYIQQLFRRYGQQDRLDFRGFQNLLLSLGLGEVRVVGLEHDDLGHDHVAHLDLLEVQEGLHSHSAGHSHPLPNSHSHHNHHHHSHGEAGGGQPTVQEPCSPSFTAGARPTVRSGALEQHSPDLDKDSDHEDRDHHKHLHGHAHDHNHDHDKHDQTHQTDHTSLKDQTQQHHNDSQEHNDLRQDHNPLTHTNSHEVGNTQPHHHHEHHHHKHPHPHNHHHHTPDTTDQLNPTQPTLDSNAEPSNLEPSSPTQLPTTRPKRVRRPPKARGHRSRNKTANTFDPTVSTEREDHNLDDDSHNERVLSSLPHKEKRAVPVDMTSPNISLTGHFEDVPHQHEECLNLTQLLQHYGLSPDSLISPAQFTYLCPALLYQIDSRVCIRHYHQVALEETQPHSVWIWVWGFVSITVISLLSLLGVVLVPILNQSCFKYLLTFLVALAVGTLSGDALLHLLPHSQGGHDHSHGENDAAEEEMDLLTEFDGVWKGLTALAGIYLLFIIEHCISMVKHYKDQGGSFCRRKKRGEEGKIGRKLSDHKLNRRSDAEWMHLRPLTEGSHNDAQLNELQPLDSANKPALTNTDSQNSSQQETAVSATENGRKAKTKKHGHGHGHSHGHSHHGHCHTDKEMKDAGIASIAWMVIMGDGMHNFSDGLAIGAAFSANITGGISTSVAVFCHELPHELGDFAVLLKAGMSVKQAIVYNLLSALMAYFGMVIGTAVGQYTHNVTSWIFAVTAGMFLYVALVDMLPEMLHGDSEEHKRCHLGHFVLQNLGMLTGFGIMLLIAIFEDHIVLDLDF